MRRSILTTCSRRQALAAFGLASLAAREAFAAPEESPLQYPIAIAADSDGALYVTDLLLPGVWKITDGKASVFYRAEKKYRAPLTHPRAIACVEKDAILVADTTARDLFFVKAGEAPKGLTGRRLMLATAITGVDGVFYVADTQRDEIWKGTVADKWAKWAAVATPRGLAIDQEKRLLVVSGRDNILYRLSADGASSEKVAQGEPTGYWSSVAIAADGAPVVVDSYAKTLWRIEGGKPAAWVKDAAFDHPVHIVRSGEVFFVTDSRAKAIFEVSSAGKVTQLPISKA